MKKIRVNSDMAAAGLGAVVAWAWNGFGAAQGHGPEMPAEVSAPLAVILARVFRWLSGWLPDPT